MPKAIVRHSVDFHETFSRVAKLNSDRALLSLVIKMDWELHQLDVKNITHGDLHEEVFTHHPLRFVAEGESDQVCILKKFIYGLKQSPTAWFDKFSSLLLQVGFKRTVSNYYVFTKKTPQGCIILVVCVYDIIISGRVVSDIQSTKLWLQSQLHIKDLGKLQYFLGIVGSRNSNGILLNQSRYVFDLLEETGFKQLKSADTPLMKSLPSLNPKWEKY